MDLMCLENASKNRSYTDLVLLEDHRVLHNMLKTETKYMLPSQSYFGSIQKDITPQMRKIVAQWMFEVCDEQKCQADVFPLAMNYLDRFLCVCPITKGLFQLLGTTCIFICSKLRETRPLTADLLVYLTDNSITLQDLKLWEYVVLSKLNWEIAAVTAPEFIPYIIHNIPLGKHFDEKIISRYAHTFAAVCARENKFCHYNPSIIAAASVAAALYGIGWTRSNEGASLNELLARLDYIIMSDEQYIRKCMHEIEEVLHHYINFNENEEIHERNLQTPVNS